MDKGVLITIIICTTIVLIYAIDTYGKRHGCKSKKWTHKPAKDE